MPSHGFCSPFWGYLADGQFRLAFGEVTSWGPPFWTSRVVQIGLMVVADAQIPNTT